MKVCVMVVKSIIHCDQWYQWSLLSLEWIHLSDFQCKVYQSHHWCCFVVPSYHSWLGDSLLSNMILTQNAFHTSEFVDLIFCLSSARVIQCISGRDLWYTWPKNRHVDSCKFEASSWPHQVKRTYVDLMRSKHWTANCWLKGLSVKEAPYIKIHMNNPLCNENCRRGFQESTSLLFRFPRNPW